MAGSKEYRRKEQNFLMQELYEEFNSIFPVAERVGLSPSTVHRRLKQVGLTKGRGKRRFSCIDCEKPTTGATRCEFHTKMRNAQNNLAAVHRYKAKKLVDALK